MRCPLPDGHSPDGNWHTLGSGRFPGKLASFRAGKQVWQLADKQVPDEPMHLVMNLTVGGECTGRPDQTTGVPATLSIGHVLIQGNDSTDTKPKASPRV